MTLRKFIPNSRDAFAFGLAAAAIAGCAAAGDDPRATMDPAMSAGGDVGAGGFSSAGAPHGAGGSLPPGTDCSIVQVLEEKCQVCHGEKKLAGAPISLMTLADFQAASWSDPNVPVHQKVQQRIRDVVEPMPPTGELTQQELASFDSWFVAGMPDCFGPQQPMGAGGANPGGGGSLTGGGGTLTGAGGADPSAGGAPQGAGGAPGPSIEPELCFEFRAHAAGSDAPYTVRTGQHYYNFVFQAPYDVPMQGLTFTPLVESESVHHFLLFEYLGAGTPVDNEGIGLHPNSQLVTGWAPGGNPPDMPPGVGFELPAPGKWYELEIHYFNTTTGPDTDHSGFEICATSQLQPPERTATITWLGTENIAIPGLSEAKATGTCNPRNPGGGDITILNSVPHMHQVGARMTTIINRVGGGTETLIDEPFDFYDQRSYETPAVLHPGDTLTTTCTFENPNFWNIYFGPGSESEMCYNFVIGYPAKALHNPGNSLEGAQNTCLW